MFEFKISKIFFSNFSNFFSIITDIEARRRHKLCRKRCCKHCGHRGSYHAELTYLIPPSHSFYAKCTIFKWVLTKNKYYIFFQLIS